MGRRKSKSLCVQWKINSLNGSVDDLLDIVTRFENNGDLEPKSGVRVANFSQNNLSNALDRKLHDIERREAAAIA